MVTSVGRKRMGKALSVQIGRALPMGRCASPPPLQLTHVPPPPAVPVRVHFKGVGPGLHLVVVELPLFFLETGH